MSPSTNQTVIRMAQTQTKDPSRGADENRMIKKYPNRRLYDTATSSYITLTDVKALVLQHVDFKVVDAKTGEDLTRSILLQIILEEESGGMPMFSSDMLSQIIRFYGHAMQGMMGNYLEKNIHTFIDMQHRLQDQYRSIYGENPMLNSDAWSQFLKIQGPAMQGLMGNYLDQSAKMFLEMQQQLQKQTRSLFSGFPFSSYGGEAGVGDKPAAEHKPEDKPAS